MFIHYLPRRVTYGLIHVFARPLVFRSAAKARNPYTHGVKGGVLCPTFSSNGVYRGLLPLLFFLFSERKRRSRDHKNLLQLC